MLLNRKRLDDNDIFHVLSNPRRRKTIEQLSNTTGTIELRELAKRVAAEESGEDPPPRDVRRTVYISLHQTHLPTLDKLGIVDYDDDRKVVRLRDRAREVELYMSVVTRFGITWADYYRGLGVSGLFFVVAALAEAPLVAVVDPLAWGVVFLLAFLLSTLYQLWNYRHTLVKQLLT